MKHRQVQSVWGFSQDNRYLIATAGDWAHNQGRSKMTLSRTLGIVLWDLEGDVTAADCD